MCQEEEMYLSGGSPRSALQLCHCHQADQRVMYDGKKGIAQKIVYDAFEIVGKKTGKPPLEAFMAALDNVMPVLEVKARRSGRSHLSGAD